MEKQHILIIVRGLPGSGKSTFAEKIVQAIPDSAHYESDSFFMRSGKYVWKPELAFVAHRICEEKTAKSLDQRKVTVVSNTFTRESELKNYFAMAEAKNAKVIVFRMENSFPNVHGVPDETLEKMKLRFIDVEGERKVFASTSDAEIENLKKELA
jgi:predicted kinase